MSALVCYSNVLINSHAAASVSARNGTRRQKLLYANPDCGDGEQWREAVGLLSLWAAESVQTIFIGIVIKVNVPVGCLQVNSLK